MFIPVQIRSAIGPGTGTVYDRSIETSRKFDLLGRQVENMTVPLTAIGGDLHTQLSAAFATEGASGATGKWKVLSDNPTGHGYRSWKESHAPGTPILVGLRPLIKGTRGHRLKRAKLAPSGQMRRELLDPLATHVSPRRLLYAPMSDIAGFHEMGTDRMPARPPLDLSLRFLHSVDRTFARWLSALLDAMRL